MAVTSSRLSFRLISCFTLFLRLAEPFTSLPTFVHIKSSFPLFNEKLDQLLHQAKLSSPKVSPLPGPGFCNAIYRIRDGEKEFVAKLLSQMALDRRPTSSSFQIDLLASSYGIGPRVIECTDYGTLMEFLDGACLAEDNINSPNRDSTLYKIATQLKKFHSLPMDMKDPNMLWFSLEAMLKDSSLNKYLQDELDFQKQKIVPLVPQSSMVCGHGDFKPSNIYITKEKDSVRFIDFELSGLNYRGFDVAKLFRTEGDRNLESQRLFIKAYTENPHDVKLLQLEASVFEPLAWFEAAVFFDYAARRDDPSNAEQWRDLFKARMACYDASVKHFETSVASLEAYISQNGSGL